MTALSALPAKKIVAAIAGAAERWADADFPPRVRAQKNIAGRTGYSAPVVEYALDRLFESVTAPALTATICDELGSLAILDDFVQRPGRTSAWAAPIGNICIISSRTTIGVALAPAIFALCAKCRVLVKDREDALASGFFETLAEEQPLLAEAAAAQAWRSEGEDAPDLSAFDAVVAFGRTQTLQTIRSALAPEARFIGYGSRLSAGYVAREALNDDDAAAAMAQAAARDIVLYDTEGCLSLHLLFVEDGGAIPFSRFSELLERAIESAAVEFPPGANLAAAIAQEQGMRAFREATGTTQFMPARGTRPQLVHGPGDALEYLRAHSIPLEGFATAGDRSDVVQLAKASGAAHVTRFGGLQDAPLQGNHGGRSRIADFVRWVDKTI